MERTFVAVKPDGVQRGLVGEIISRLERKGYKIVAMKMLVPSEELVSKHYEEHIGKSFFPRLLKYLSSGPVVAMVLEGMNIVHGVRHIVGATNPDEADVGTIRADFAQIKQQNVVHASDCIESANREIGIWFDDSELCNEEQSFMESLMVQELGELSAAK